MFLFRYNDYASSRAKGLGDYNVDRKPLASEDGDNVVNRVSGCIVYIRLLKYRGFSMASRF